jgi:hypothetical protein
MRDKLIKLLLESDIKDKYDAADKADEILDLFNVVAMLSSDDEIEKSEMMKRDQELGPYGEVMFPIKKEVFDKIPEMKISKYELNKDKKK